MKNVAKWEGSNSQDLEGLLHVKFVPIDTIGNTNMHKILINIECLFNLILHHFSKKWSYFSLMIIFLKNVKKWEGLSPQDFEGSQHVGGVPMDTIWAPPTCWNP